MTCSYYQNIAWSIFYAIAAPNGMFLVGFALALGAKEYAMGVVMAVPPLFVVFQFLAAYLVERDWSRKKLTIVFTFLVALSWLLVTPLAVWPGAFSTTAKVTLLITVVSLMTVAQQFVNTARSSWVGELIPGDARGRFFAVVGIFGNLTGAVCGIVTGKLIDVVETRGIYAFVALFIFSTVFGVITALFYLPQPDCPLPRKRRGHFGLSMRLALRNKPLMRLALVNSIIATSGIQLGLGTVYLKRDVGLTYLQMGVLTAIWTGGYVIGSFLWGRWVTRYGCRPLIIVGCLMMAPTCAVWPFIPPGAVVEAMVLISIGNLICGAGNAGLNIAVATLQYKASRPQGRSVQFAVYGVLVTLVGAPMPFIGGWLVPRLQAAGYNVDLRLLFYLWATSIFLSAAAAALLVREPESVSAKDLVYEHTAGRLLGWLTASQAALRVLVPIEWARTENADGASAAKVTDDAAQRPGRPGRPGGPGRPGRPGSG